MLNLSYEISLFLVSRENSSIVLFFIEVLICQILKKVHKVRLDKSYILLAS